MLEIQRSHSRLNICSATEQHTFSALEFSHSVILWKGPQMAVICKLFFKLFSGVLGKCRKISKWKDNKDLRAQGKAVRGDNWTRNAAPDQVQLIWLVNWFRGNGECLFFWLWHLVSWPHSSGRLHACNHICSTCFLKILTRRRLLFLSRARLGPVVWPTVWSCCCCCCSSHCSTRWGRRALCCGASCCLQAQSYAKWFGNSVDFAPRHPAQPQDNPDSGQY